MSLAEFLDESLLDRPAARTSEDVLMSALRRGARGTISSVGAGAAEAELERRLLELGFVEGAQIEILHEGLLGRDPLAIRLDERRVALRRREAQLIRVRLDGPR